MILTIEQLVKDGCVENPHMPLIDGGFQYCRTCLTYNYHDAMSHHGISDCYEVCRVCQTYTGPRQLRNK